MATLNAVATAKPTAQSAGQYARLYGRRDARRYAQQIHPTKGEGRDEGCGSWKAPSTFVPCIGTLNLTVRQNLFGVPPSGGPDRLKPGHQTVGSWRARTPVCRAMGP